MREVTVLLRGGLGNQLFQFAAGWIVATVQNSRLVIDHSLVSLRGTSDRPLALPSFLLPPTHGDIPGFRCRWINGTRAVGALRRSRRRLAESIRLPLVLTDVEVPTYCAEVKEGRPVKTIRLIDGYFGSADLVDLCERHGFPQALPLASPSLQYLEARQRIQGTPAVHLHVRLGDFLTLELAKSPEWYATAALSALEDAASGGVDMPSVLRVFTDALHLPQAYREALADICQPKQILTVDRSSCPDGASALDLLSRSRVVVYDPDSTFGWWAHRWSRYRSRLLRGPNFPRGW